MPADSDEQLENPNQDINPREVIRSLIDKYEHLEPSAAQTPEQAAKIKKEISTILKGAPSLIVEMAPTIDDLSSPNTFVYNSAQLLNDGPSKDSLNQQLEAAIVERGQFTTTYHPDKLFQAAREIANENNIKPDNMQQWGNLAYGALCVYQLAENGTGTSQTQVSNARVAELLPKD